jgi:uncharacterized protein (TIGR02118 family)
MMVRRLTLVRRAEHLTKEEFIEHWRGAHARLGMMLPGLRGYRLNAIIQSPEGFEWDGVAELWFDSLEAAAHAFSVEPLRSQLTADSSTLIAKATPFFIEEFTVLKPPTTT